LKIYNKILFSIVTVVYNGEKHLECAIQSIINQTYKNIEYIIIDGGSTDNTLQIIKKYDSTINHWISEPDNGIYDAMNKGIKKATGDYIGILNSDDFYEPDALQIMVDEIKKAPEADILFGDLFMINEYLSEKQLQTCMRGKNLENGFSIWHPTTFVRREVYNKFGLFDTSYKIAADYELLLRFRKRKCHFKYINQAITNFREGGISSYNFLVIQETDQLLRTHTGWSNAVKVKYRKLLVYILQKIFMFLLGQKRYHQITYKYIHNKTC